MMTSQWASVAPRQVSAIRSTTVYLMNTLGSLQYQPLCNNTWLLSALHWSLWESRCSALNWVRQEGQIWILLTFPPFAPLNMSTWIIIICSACEIQTVCAWLWGSQALWFSFTKQPFTEHTFHHVNRCTPGRRGLCHGTIAGWKEPEKNCYESWLLFALVALELELKFLFHLVSSSIGKYHFNGPYDFAKAIPKAYSGQRERYHEELNCCA